LLYIIHTCKPKAPLLFGIYRGTPLSISKNEKTEFIRIDALKKAKAVSACP
jgi:hypothetical protein